MHEFDITIIDKTGKANVVVNFLSQLHVPNDLATIDDSFLDENLFFCHHKIHSMWILQIS